MAKKRVNKKLLTVLLLITIPILIVGMLLYDSRRPFLPAWVHKMTGRDPQTLMSEAEDLIKQADRLQQQVYAQAAAIKDPQKAYELKEKFTADKLLPRWKEIQQILGTALRYSGNDRDLQNKIFALKEKVYRQEGDYARVRAVWAELFKRDATNYDAKRKEVEFLYTAAKSSNSPRAWASVATQAEYLIKLRPNDAYGYAVEGHADLQTLKAGAGGDPKTLQSKVETLLNKALSLKPNYVLVYSLLAQFNEYKAETADNAVAKSKYMQAAEKLLSDCLNKNPNSVDAHLNYIKLYLLYKADKLLPRILATTDKVAQAKLVSQRNDLINQSLVRLDRAIKLLPGQGRLYALKGQLLSTQAKSRADIEQAIKLYQKALQCKNISGENKGQWYAMLGDLYITLAEQSDNPYQQWLTGYKVLRKALYLPAMTNMAGPDRVKVAQVRYARLIPLFIDASGALAEQAQDTKTQSMYMERAKRFLKELRDALGSSNVLTQICLGTIELAEGKTEQAIQDLYKADSRNEVKGALARRLQKKLSRALSKDGQYALAADYAIKAMQSGRRSLQDYINCMRIVSHLPGLEGANLQLSLITAYEKYLASNNVIPSAKYQQEVLKYKVESLIRAGRYGDAQQAARKLAGQGKDVELLRARAQATEAERIAALQKYISKYPGDEGVVRILYTYYISQAKQDASYYDKARKIVAAALKVSPDNITFKQMAAILREPDPAKVSVARQREIRLSILKQIADPFERASKLGDYYITWAKQQVASTSNTTGTNTVNGAAANNNTASNSAVSNSSSTNNAVANEYWKKALGYLQQASKLKKDDEQIRTKIFYVALSLKDWNLAKQLIDEAVKRNSLEGLRYEADLASAQQNWSLAADRLERYLKQHPISVAAHLSLSEAYSKLGRDADALAQVRLAVSQDRFNLTANRRLLSMIHANNLKTGLNNLDSASIAEVLTRVQTILSIDAGDLTACRMMVLYTPLWTKYLSSQLKQRTLTAQDRLDIQKKMDTIYQQAVKVCRYLISRQVNNSQDWQMLAQLTYNYSRQVTDPVRKKQLEDEVNKIYQQGLAQHPESSALAAAYALFMQQSGRGQQADAMMKNMIKNSKGAVREQYQLNLCKIYYSRGQYAQARQILQTVLKENPNNRSAGIMLAELAVAQGKFNQAIQYYEQLRKQKEDEKLIAREIEILQQSSQLSKSAKLLETMQKEFPTSNYLKLLLAQQSLQSAQYAKAQAYAQEILAKDPGNTNAYMIECKALFYSGQYQKVLDKLNMLRVKLPENSNVGRLLLAQVYWQMLRYNDAIGQLQIALSINPNYTQAESLFVKMLSARRRWLDLENYFVSKIKRNPNQPGAYVSAAQADWNYADQNQASGQSSKAARYYRKALGYFDKAWQLSKKLNQQKQAVLNVYLSFLMKISRYQQVIQLVQENLTGKVSDASLLLYEAEATYKQGKKAQALKQFENILKLVANDSTLRDMVVSNARRVGDPADIITWCNNAISKNPNSAVLHMVLAGEYQATVDVNKAIEQYQVAARLAKSTPAVLSGINKQLAMLYLQNSMFDKAIVLYRDIVKNEPDNYSILNNFAYALLKRGTNPDEALKMARKANMLVPANANIMDTYAMALLQKKMYSEAEMVLRRAIQQLQGLNEVVTP